MSEGAIYQRLIATRNSEDWMKGRSNQETRGDPHEPGFQRDDGGKGHPVEKSKKDIERELDKALADSFPSSDPPSISQPGPTEPAGDPKVKP